jgi:hypothetical protein
MDHCLAKIAEIIARKAGDRRSVFQLGYNLGRLSELTSGGREVFWDPWKEAVSTWNQEELERLARELPRLERLARELPRLCCKEETSPD